MSRLGLLVGLSVALITYTPSASGELVILQPGSAEAVGKLLSALPPDAVILHESHQDGSVLIRTQDGSSLSHLPASGRIVRNVDELPVGVRGGVRILLETAGGMLGNPPLIDDLVDYAEILGGQLAWRSKIVNYAHFDIPADRLSDFVAHPAIGKYWFNTPGEGPSLAQSVPRVGVTGSFGPHYWPSRVGVSTTSPCLTLASSMAVHSPVASITALAPASPPMTQKPLDTNLFVRTARTNSMVMVPQYRVT